MEVDNTKHFLAIIYMQPGSLFRDLFNTVFRKREKKMETAQTSKPADFILHFHCLHHGLKLKICKAHYNKKEKSKAVITDPKKQIKNVRGWSTDVLLHNES